MLHYFIVGMSIDPDRVVMLQREAHRLMEDTLHLSTAGYTMDRGIRSIA